MSSYQIAYKINGPKAVDVIIQQTGDTLPGGYSAAATAAVLSDAGDAAGPDTSQQLFHLVRQALHDTHRQMSASNQNANYGALHDPRNWTINVVHPTAIAATPNPVTIAHNATQQLTLTHTPANSSNRNVTYKSSDVTKATVSRTGLITGVAAGNCSITVTEVDSEGAALGVSTVVPVTLT